MLEATHSRVAPWTLVDFNDQRVGRLTLIRHLLDQIPDRKVKETLIEFRPWATHPCASTSVHRSNLSRRPTEGTSACYSLTALACAAKFPPPIPCSASRRRHHIESYTRAAQELSLTQSAVRAADHRTGRILGPAAVPAHAPRRHPHAARRDLCAAGGRAPARPGARHAGRDVAARLRAA